MDRKILEEKITEYKSTFAIEEEYRQRFLNLLQNEPHCFLRKLEHGHITGSALIVSPNGKQVLLLHHRKLDRWLQPGGHADGDENVARVAEKEAREETGLQSIRLANPNILDLDIHSIPARGTDPEHLHYDIRFLFTAEPEEPLQQNRESKALAWLPLEEVSTRTGNNSSINRMLLKIPKVLGGEY